MTRSDEVNDRLHTPAGRGDRMLQRDSVRTRARILAAAQRIFSVNGYAQAGVREIAAEAGINVALVARYFGPKEKLFEAALDATLKGGTFWDRPREEFGRSLVATFFDEESETPNPLPMLMQASTDPTAQAVALSLLQTRIAAPLAEWLGEPDGEARAAEALALTAGVFFYRIMLPLKYFSGSLDPATRQWLEEALQAIADGRSAAPRSPAA